MQRIHALFLAGFLFATMFIAGCHRDPDSNNPTDPGNPTTSISTTIAGLVTDENGKPLADVSVNAQGASAVKTNENGFFILRNVRVPSDRCFILATHSGYFNAARAEVPRSNNVTHMRLSMMSNAPTHNFPASSGKKVSLSDGSSIDFPANAYVNASNGSPYTGTVRVAARHLDPTSPTFFNYFAGDFTAQRTDGSRTDLLSYGVLRVEMTGSAGEKLQLSTGKTATLTYPISSSMQSGAPSEMPLWYFDEQLGMWKEEGRAVKQGSIYTGEVNHFSEWNCDYPGNTAELDGVVSCGSEPVPGIIVIIGERHAITDENGHYHQRVPAGISFEISVRAEQNMGTMMAPKSVGPYTAGNATENLVVSPCPAYVTGKLVDCDNAPIGGPGKEGVIQVVGANFYNFATTDANGNFKVRVMVADALTLTAFDYQGTMSMPLSVNALESGETKNIGNIQACNSTDPLTYMDIDVIGTAQQAPNVQDLALSPDGSRLAAVMYNGIRIYDTQNGALLQTIDMNVDIHGDKMGPVEFSNDGTKLASSVSGVYKRTGSVYIWDVGTGQNIRTFSYLADPHFLPDGATIIGTELTSQSDVVKLDIASGSEIGRYPHDRGFVKLIGARAGGTQFVATRYLINQQQAGAFVWDMNTNTLADEFVIEGSVPSTNSTVSYLSLDGNTLTVSRGEKMYAYNVLTGQLLHTTILSPGISAFVLAPDHNSFLGQGYASSQTAPPPAIYTLPGGAVSHIFPTFTGSPFYNSFALNRQGSQLAAGACMAAGHQKIRIWYLP